MNLLIISHLKQCQVTSCQGFILNKQTIPRRGLVPSKGLNNQVFGIILVICFVCLSRIYNIGVSIGCKQFAFIFTPTIQVHCMYTLLGIMMSLVKTSVISRGFGIFTLVSGKQLNITHQSATGGNRLTSHSKMAAHVIPTNGFLHYLDYRGQKVHINN